MPSGEKLLTGKLISSQGTSAFKYENSYLKNKNAIPIDPINLPLSNAEHHISKPLFSVFDDALPDDWGRKLMVKKYNLKHEDQRPENLLSMLGKNSIGAFSFKLDQGSVVAHKRVEFQAEKSSIEIIAIIAARYERGENISNNDMIELYHYGASVGGAHPKVLFEIDKRKVIAKFNSFKDSYDIVSLEAATLKTASGCGMDIPAFSVLEFNSKLNAILIDRFDITIDDAGNESGRNHLISMQTLANVSGYYRTSYSDLAQIVKQLSYISNDNENLYKQMVFNSVIGNTDDHLKNFSMINDGKGYRLSPAYDILPNITSSRDHILSFLDDTICPYRSMLISMSNRFFMHPDKSEEIISSVCNTIKHNWVSNCVKYSVPKDQILKIGLDIDRRLRKISEEDQFSLDYSSLSPKTTESTVELKKDEL